MKDFNENEIQVLGQNNPEPDDNEHRNNKHIIIFVAIIIGAVFTILLFINSGLFICYAPTTTDTIPATDSINEEYVRVRDKRHTISDQIQKSEVLKKEFVQNDISMDIYLLVNLKAELSFETPDPMDKSIYLAFLASDIRGDNQEIVCDFVIDGVQYSRGKWRKGFCSIIKGEVTLGKTDKDDILELCIENEADFFRQYSLVHNGKAQIMDKDKKEVRRALAMQGEELFFIETKYGESLGNFAVALQDMGFNEAIHITGGKGRLLVYKENGRNKVCGKDFSFENKNYLIFRGN